MTIAVTGASGFIGQNLVTRLTELGFEVTPIAHKSDDAELLEKLKRADLVIHLAGVNRPIDTAEFVTGNQGMTQRLVQALTQLGRATPLAYASSIQAANDDPYGASKRAAETLVKDYGAQTGAPTHVLRLPNVFGKWCRPNYNSVVATFCHNIARGLPISIRDPAIMLKLVYIDDVVAWFATLAAAPSQTFSEAVEPVYETSLGDLAAQIERFRDSRKSLLTGAVGTGFLRALHATYVSYLEPSNFQYALTAHTDQRGSFAEMLRTPDCGQFSYFTAHPGITRGGHYHHTKTEKFLVVHGKARFGFRHILTGQTHEIVTSSDEPHVVETVPGWSHDITNIGDEVMVVMLWANELFDRDKPDTVAAKVLTP